MDCRRVAFSFQFAILRRLKLRKEKLFREIRARGAVGLATCGGPMQLSVAERATQAHGVLRQSGTVPSNLLAAEIYESWLRCVALGLDSTRPPSIDLASPRVLRSEQEERVLLRGLGAGGNANLARPNCRFKLPHRLCDARGSVARYRRRQEFRRHSRGQEYSPWKSLVGNALRHKWHRYGRVPQASRRRPRQRALFPEFRFIDLRCISDFCAGWFTSGHP